jgi:hypothetical protein
MEEEQYIDIEISKYDIMFDEWLEETGTYLDQYCMNRVQRKFDESMGLEHYEYIVNDKEHEEDMFRFRMIDGPKYMLAILKYNLYDNRTI